MPAPTTDGNPSRYKPNPEDDRALAGTPMSAAYLQLAIAIEAVEELRTIDDQGPRLYLMLPPASRKAVNAAESALRRAAFTLVLYAPEKEA